MKISNNNHGFTLIETLVAIVIIGILGSSASVTLFSLLRGASKADIIKEVKQNGDYAITVMEIKIRNSQNVPICTGVASNQLTITNIDNTTSVFQCDATTNVLKEVINGTTTKVLTSATVSIPASPTPCDTSNVSFTCTPTSTGAKIVSIVFNLSQSSSNATVAETSSQNFRTRINLRNK